MNGNAKWGVGAVAMLAALTVGLFVAPNVWDTFRAKRVIASDVESAVTEFREIRRVGDLVCGQVATESHPDFRNFWVSHGKVGMVAPGKKATPEIFSFWFQNWSRCK